MMILLKDRVTYVWLVLFALTLLSWLLADGLAPDTASGVKYLSVSLLALAFFKIRLVILYFMEVLDAPWPLRGLLEAWVVLVFAGMCFLYLFGVPV